jgi:hypothetical protein
MSKDNISLFTRISHGGQFANEHGSHAVKDDQSVACCCVAHGADGFSGWGVVFCLFRQVDLANLLHKFKQKNKICWSESCFDPAHLLHVVPLKANHVPCSCGDDQVMLGGA